MWGWVGPRACLGDKRNLLTIPGFETPVRRAYGMVTIRTTVPGLLVLWHILFLRLKYFSLVSDFFTSFATYPRNVIALVCTYETIYCWPYEIRFDSVVTDKWSVWPTIPVTWRYRTWTHFHSQVAILHSKFRISAVIYWSCRRTVHPLTEQDNAKQSESDERSYLWNKLALSMAK